MFSTASKALIRAPFCMSKGMTGAVSRVLSLDGHLSGTRVAARLKPPVGTDGPPMVPVGVAADRVYRPPMLPWGAVSPYLAFPPLPSLHYGDTAVFLCCTIPGVAPGGRYPLSLPCAARTFLMHNARDRLHQSRYPVYPKKAFPSNLYLQNWMKSVILYIEKKAVDALL